MGIDWHRDRQNRHNRDFPKSARVRIVTERNMNRIVSLPKRDAEYIRLRDGTVGLKVKGETYTSLRVRIKKSDGTIVEETVRRVLGNRDGYWYCTIQKDKP